MLVQIEKDSYSKEGIERLIASCYDIYLWEEDVRKLHIGIVPALPSRILIEVIDQGDLIIALALFGNDARYKIL